MYKLYTQKFELFTEVLQKTYKSVYGSMDDDYCDIISFVANTVMEIISGTDALYHNDEHTMHVTLVAQEIIRGKHLKQGGVTPKEWAEFVISALCHDIGYIKGVCAGDDLEKCLFETGGPQRLVHLNHNTTDASLTPYHVTRGQLFVRQRFGKMITSKELDLDAICKNIELTRFPVPKDEDHADTTGYPGLLRAADLIGQLSDPKYSKKVPALFYEFVETGEAERRGWKTPGDVKRSYPSFFINVVKPYIDPALAHLRSTMLGVSVIASLIMQVEFATQFVN